MLNMLDERVLLERIDSMPLEDLVRIMKEALEDSHIPYIEGSGKIVLMGSLKNSITKI